MASVRKGRAKTLPDFDAASRRASPPDRSPKRCARSSAFLTHPVFNTHHSETEMLRYLRKLADKDLALDRSDDPAGLLHDEAERHQRDDPDHLAGVRADASVRAAADQLSRLSRSTTSSVKPGCAQATGYAGISLQPNAGSSQGEYAGLLAIIQGLACTEPRRSHGATSA